MGGHVFVKASVNNGEIATDILQFHIDPPFEEPIQLHTILLFVMVGALVTVISVWYIDHRRLTNLPKEMLFPSCSKCGHKFQPEEIKRFTNNRTSYYTFSYLCQDCYDSLYLDM